MSLFRCISLIISLQMMGLSFAASAALAQSAAPPAGVPAVPQAVLNAGLAQAVAESFDNFIEDGRAEMRQPGTVFFGSFGEDPSYMAIEYVDLDSFVARCADRVGTLGTRTLTDDQSCFSVTPERMTYNVFAGVPRAYVRANLLRRVFTCERETCRLQAPNTSTPAELLREGTLVFHFVNGSWEYRSHDFVR